MIRGSLGGCPTKTSAHTTSSHRMTGLYTEHSQKMFVYVSKCDPCWEAAEAGRGVSHVEDGR
jgi:hypothetical protein